MATTYLTRTPSSNGNQKIWTWSGWIKINGKSGDSTYQYLWEAYYGNSYRYSYACLRHGTIEVYGGDYTTGGSSSMSFDVTTTRLLRDPNAWYHIVVAMDTTQSTSTDRLKIYINGVQETSFQGYVGSGASATFPAQDDVTFFNVTTTSNRIGKAFDGSMSHVHFCDGQQLAPTVFGSTDTNGQWKINTSPSFTPGTNGFTVLKDGDTITDQSANSNNFSLGAGTLTKTEDCPSNVYCTFNPLIPQGLAYANGNLSATHNASSWKTAYGTIAMSGTGKYYFESKVSTLGSYQGVGIVDAEQISAGASKFGAVSRGYGYKNDGSKTNNNSDASYGATYTTGDIIGCALDLTNGAIYFSKNGAWQNSATTGEIAAGTTTNAAYTSISSSYVYLPAVQIYGSGTNQFNAGNGIFGTTAVSSVQNPSSGDTSAKFEYTPPTGFQPITTKGLNA